MALTISHLICFFLSSLLLSFLFPATSSGSFRHSFKHLEGSKKGDNREGIQKVKQYLQRYGYLNSVSPEYSDSDDFDDLLESSLKTFQSFYHLSRTGILDDPRATLMSKPRCGFPDHPPSANSTIHPDYTFWEGQKWPSGHMHIHYIPFPDGHPEEAITRSFDAWATVSNFTFERVLDEKFAEVEVHFVVQDGPGGVLAYARLKPKPAVMMDKEDCWVVGALPDCFDMDSTVTHEIGHILGLGHSQDRKAVMYAYTGANETKHINQDDIDGIRAKYST